MNDGFLAFIALVAITLLTFSFFIPSEKKKVGCTFGAFDPDVTYVVGPSKDYVLTGGTSTDPKVANAYNYGVLYADCR